MTICECLHFIPMWKTLAWSRQFTNGEFWTQTTRLNPPLCIEVPVLLSSCTKTGKWEIMYMCLGYRFYLFFFTIERLDFGAVPTVWYSFWLLIFIFFELHVL